MATQLTPLRNGSHGGERWVDLGSDRPRTPLGVCDRVLHSDQSFTVGKRLRMGHYAVILQLRFRLNRKGKLVGQQMAHKIRIGDHIHHCHDRRQVNGIN